MARVTVPEQDRSLDDPAEITGFLEPFGIGHERWEVAGRAEDGAPADAVLAAYGPEIERLKRRGGYVTADVIDVTAATPGLDAMLARFAAEHTHDEDEVRFLVAGRGLFHINPVTHPVFAVELEVGDLINVPAGTRHWFGLCPERRIRAIRLFRDPAGWAPRYVEDARPARFLPVCWGPAYLPPALVPPAPQP